MGVGAKRAALGIDRAFGSEDVVADRAFLGKCVEHLAEVYSAAGFRNVEREALFRMREGVRCFFMAENRCVIVIRGDRIKVFDHRVIDIHVMDRSAARGPVDAGQIEIRAAFAAVEPYVGIHEQVGIDLLCRRADAVHIFGDRVSGHRLGAVVAEGVEPVRALAAAVFLPYARKDRIGIGLAVLRDLRRNGRRDAAPAAMRGQLFQRYRLPVQDQRLQVVVKIRYHLRQLR